MNQNGAHYLFRGFGLLREAKLRRFVYLPLGVNTALFAGLGYWAWWEFERLLGWLQAGLPSWLSWLTWLLWPLFIVSSLLVLFYAFSLLAHLIAAPFNSLLAEKTQAFLTGKPLPPMSFWSVVLREAPRAFLRQWQILAYYLPRAVGVLILFLIPGVQIVAPLAWFLFCAWFMSVQYLDYPTDNNRIDFPTLRAQLKLRRWQTFSFGSVVMLLTMVPVVNFFVIPAAIVGATAMFVETWDDLG